MAEVFGINSSRIVNRKEIVIYVVSKQNNEYWLYIEVLLISLILVYH